MVSVLVSPTGLGTPTKVGPPRVVSFKHRPKGLVFNNYPLRTDGFSPSQANNKKTTFSGGFVIGEPDGIRTHDPLIKSQMLYRLSYEPSLNEWIYRI